MMTDQQIPHVGIFPRATRHIDSTCQSLVGELLRDEWDRTVPVTTHDVACVFPDEDVTVISAALCNLRNMGCLTVVGKVRSPTGKLCNLYSITPRMAGYVSPGRPRMVPHTQNSYSRTARQGHPPEGIQLSLNLGHHRMEVPGYSPEAEIEVLAGQARDLETKVMSVASALRELQQAISSFLEEDDHD